MASRHNPFIQDRFDDAQIAVQGLATRLIQLQKNVVVGHRCQNACFFQPCRLDKRHILFGGADPAGNVREGKAQILALLDDFPVPAAVEKKFTLTDDTGLAAQSTDHFEEIDDLLDRVRRPGLLTVTEGGVGNENVFRGVDRDDLVVEIDPAYLVVWEDLLLEIGLVNVDQVVPPEF